jgi:hypothetical protein
MKQYRYADGTTPFVPSVVQELPEMLVSVPRKPGTFVTNYYTQLTTEEAHEFLAEEARRRVSTNPTESP